MNTIHRSTKTSRLGSLVLAAVITLSMLQVIDMLATRDHGNTVMARAAGHVVALAAAVRTANRG
jgi:hypothetical protein